MPFPKFDQSRLRIQPLADRTHDVHLADLASLSDPVPEYDRPDLPEIARRIVAARANGRPVICMMGAHPIKRGLSRYVIDLLERGLITGIAFNGACAIHDFELALIGATSESVARYIRTGEFGLWRETGRLNDLARVPVTIHVSLGYDIIHEQPNCDGAALGAASYTDFLVFAQEITQLEGGVLLNIGTAVMGPEVYLKALSMARNLARQEGKSLSRFTTAVFDLQDLGPDLSKEAAKTEARYYFRPFKTILVRTVRDGGESYYVRQDHNISIPVLYRAILKALEEA